MVVSSFLFSLLPKNLQKMHFPLLIDISVEISEGF